MTAEFVVLVDAENNQVGVMEKHEAHEKALLHRAISIFIFNSKGELLLQQRALSKYHSAGLWTNTCCSHPREHETNLEAATRRLREEMGMACTLKEQFSFIYKTPFENGLCEHELDFVFTGTCDDAPHINPNEVMGYKWITIDALLVDVASNPNAYTSWFKIILNEYVASLGVKS